MSVTPAVGRTAASATGVLAGLLAAGLLAVGLLASPAAAHAVLIGTQPERGATVTDQLDVVVLEFSEVVSFAQVQVTGPDGTRVEEGTPVERGETVAQPLSPPLEPGTYTVAFRVTSDDGHPIEDTFAFAYDGPVAAAAVDEDPGADRETSRTGGEEKAGDVDLGAPVLILAVLVLVGFAAAALFAVRRRGDDPTGDDDETVGAGARPGDGEGRAP